MFSPFFFCSELTSSVTNKAAGPAPGALNEEDRRTPVSPRFEKRGASG